MYTSPSLNTYRSPQTLFWRTLPELCERRRPEGGWHMSGQSCWGQGGEETKLNIHCGENSELGLIRNSLVMTGQPGLMLGWEAPEKDDGTCLGISLDLLCVPTYHIDQQHSTEQIIILFSRISLSYNDCFTWAVISLCLDRETKVEMASMLCWIIVEFWNHFWHLITTNHELDNALLTEF